MINDKDVINSENSPLLVNPTREEKLLEAAFLGKYKECQKLIEQKADVNFVGTRPPYQGWTPLYAAVQRCKVGNEDYINIINLLIAKNANPLYKCPDKNNWTYPIHNAAINFNTSIIAIFLNKFVPVDIEDSRGETPLMHAIMTQPAYPNPDYTFNAVNFLCSNGADVNKQDNHKATPLWKASLLKKPDIMLYLLDKQANPNLGPFSVLLSTVTYWTPSDNKTKVVKKLLEAGSDIDVKDSMGRTALDIARGQHDAAVVKLIEDKMNQDSLSHDSILTLMTNLKSKL